MFMEAVEVKLARTGISTRLFTVSIVVAPTARPVALITISVGLAFVICKGDRLITSVSATTGADVIATTIKPTTSVCPVEATVTGTPTPLKNACAESGLAERKITNSRSRGTQKLVLIKFIRGWPNLHWQLCWI